MIDRIETQMARLDSQHKAARKEKARWRRVVAWLAARYERAAYMSGLFDGWEPRARRLLALLEQARTQYKTAKGIAAAAQFHFKAPYRLFDVTKDTLQAARDGRPVSRGDQWVIERALDRLEGNAAADETITAESCQALAMAIVNQAFTDLGHADERADAERFLRVELWRGFWGQFLSVRKGQLLTELDRRIAA